MKITLTSIGEAMLLINIIALLLVLARKQSKTAFEFVLYSAIMLGLSHLALEYYLKSLFKHEEYLQLASAAWYLGYSITYSAMIAVCIWYCKKHRLQKDKASNIILISFSIASGLQVARYIDRYVLESDILGDVYSSGIPTVNALVTISVIIYTVQPIAVSLFSDVKSSFSLRGK